ncbi:MAG TPA: AbrB/MazE/SpoVT family DNA-binding domain-containing protein [Candidatus Ozemobacteraceae bacterium]|nr:AbrB/MazE/SpoVT family DNA-binding domain-containing protein [Candidatus Ozemobacteraceae bacterium]
MASLKTNLVKIGNSQGVRLPKAVLQQIHLIDEIEIEIKRDCLVLKPANNPRAGWDEGFKKAMKAIPDSELEAWEKLQLQNDEEEWSWK